MQLIKFLQENWVLIRDNIWVFVTCAAIFFILGWASGGAFYKERIELLKARAEARSLTSEHASSFPLRFSYPAHGRHGANILSNSTHEVYVGEATSMRAEIPANSKLQIVIKMVLRNSEQAAGAWTLNVGKVANWAYHGYERKTGLVTQRFDAEPGIADIELRFAQVGDIQIEAFEGESSSPSWRHTIQVGARGR